MRSAMRVSDTRITCGKVFLATVLVFWSVFGQSKAVLADESAAPRIGVNRLNLAWLSRADQKKILKEIAASGVSDLRLSLSRPVDKSIDALEIASGLGFNILLEIQLTNKSYYPQDVLPRSGFGRIWDIYRLSDIDLDLYRKGLNEALQRIDELGIKLAAVEPGNEINFSAYNGDLLVYREPGVRTPRSIADLENRAAFKRGLDKYITVLKITKEEVQATFHSRNASIVSAGLSDISPEEGDNRGMERLDPAEVISLLRERGLDNIVDAYGIHIYPGHHSARALDERVESLLGFCQPPGAGRPCWVTEWGIANMDHSCPMDDRGREGTIRAMRETFDRLMNAGRLDAAFYYDWDTENSYSLWRCGTLSPAGELAISRQPE